MTSKLIQENKDPNLSNVIKETNENLLNILPQTTLANIISGFEEYIKFLKKPSELLIRGVSINTKTSEQLCLVTFEKKAKSYMQFLKQIEPSPSIPYQESLENKKVIEEFALIRKKFENDLLEMQTLIEQLKKEKTNFQTELTISKDTIASKQAQLSNLLEELTSTRSQLEKMSLSYQQQLQLVTQLLQEKEKFQHQAKISSNIEDPNVNDQIVPKIQTSPTSLESQVSVQESNLINFDDEENPSKLTVPVSPQTPNLLDDKDHHQVETMKTKQSSFSDFEKIPQDVNSKKYKIVLIDQNGVQSNKLNFTPEDKEREERINKFYETKMDQLTSQLKVADLKAMEFYDGYQKTLQELEKCIEQRDILENKLKNSLSTFNNTKEDLETTRTNYEQQMSVLSEHITLLNEKLGDQAEQLDELKSARIYCGKCKKWNTVDWLRTEGKNGAKCIGGNHGSYYNYI